MLQISDSRTTKLLALSEDDVKRLNLSPAVFIVDAEGNIRRN